MNSLGAHFAFRTVFGVIVYAPLTVLLAMPRTWLDSNLVRVPLIVYIISGLFVSRWLSIRAVHHFLEDGRNPDDAFWRAISDARVPLSFVPIIGGLFAPRRDGDREL